MAETMKMAEMVKMAKMLHMAEKVNMMEDGANDTVNLNGADDADSAQLTVNQLNRQNEPTV